MVGERLGLAHVSTVLEPIPHAPAVTAQLDADAAERLAQHLFGADQEETSALLGQPAQPPDQGDKPSDQEVSRPEPHRPEPRE